MKYKIEFNYRYGKDYVYCNEYREDEQFVQPLKHYSEDQHNSY